ncbi:MAG: threonine aldolase family protein, partial [Acidimicrobiia bacterium]|nr:threonine aldolase family protein [Acidimicrobiia bacterium]
MAFTNGLADFRSDTVTRPTEIMRKAMAGADVGDDVYGEDPTVNLLQDRCAELMGKERALFVPSGTMGNQIAINLQTRPGQGAVCVESAHVRRYEVAAAAALSGVQWYPVASSGGVMTPAEIEAASQSTDYHVPEIRLLCWENTHNTSGGTVVPLSVMREGSAAARQNAMSIHLDGARIFNAAAAEGVEASSFAAEADTIQFCLSKGLGAPVGSMLCGPGDLMTEARRVRKRFGGGMRQAGVIAAAGLVALEQRHHLAEDHALAGRLAVGLADRRPGSTDPSACE